MKKGGGSESTIIIGPSKSVLVYALPSLEYVLRLARFRVFVPNYIYYKNCVWKHTSRRYCDCYGDFNAKVGVEYVVGRHGVGAPIIWLLAEHHPSTVRVIKCPGSTLLVDTLIRSITWLCRGDLEVALKTYSGMG